MAKYQIHLIFCLLREEAVIYSLVTDLNFSSSILIGTDPWAFIECVETKCKEIFSLEIFAIN